MTTHVSATARQETSHLTEPTTISDTDSPQSLEQDEGDSNEGKIEALTEIICGAGDEAAAALLVLMSMLEKSTQPQVLANTAKHCAFTHCGELNLFGMVDAQIATVEGELFSAISRSLES